MALIDGTPDDDFLVGTPNADTINGFAGNDTERGKAGDDTLNGDDGHDFLVGGDGNDVLNGGNGDDYLRGSEGNDQINGGAGYDRAAFTVLVNNPANGETGVQTGATVNLNLQGIAQDTGHGMDVLTGIEHVSGTAYADTLIGDGGDNWIWGEGGDDNLEGGGGNDLVEMDTGNSVLDGGSGIDTAGFQGSDTFTAGVNVSLALQGSGQTIATGSSVTLTNFENLTGTLHDDTLTGDSAANILAGNSGNDHLLGGDGGDTLYGDGSIAPDTHDIGGSGPITTFADVNLSLGADSGDDVLEGGLGDDVLYGGGGSDTASWEHSTAGVQAQLYDGGFGEAFGDADGYDQLNDIENLAGSAFSDTLLGNNDDNVLTGNDGHDFLYGFGGNDILLGGAGDDFLRGYEGDDILNGGSGIDRVSFYIGASPPSAVTVDLRVQGVAQNTGYGMDTLIGIEHASGTILSDTLIGNSQNNWLWGGSDGIAGGTTGDDTISAGAGNDLVEVGAGNHTLDGGTGNDTLSLSGETLDISPAGVTFSLALQGAAQDSEQGMMNATGFENLSGTIYDDSLTGNDGSNVLAGDTGNDTLSGGKGSDTLYGDGRIGVDSHGLGGSGPITTWGDIRTFDPSLTDGNDTLSGGNGADTLYGGGGDDVMSGGSGTDTFVIEANSGDDVITDFSRSQDLIRFDISGVDDFSDLTVTASGAHDALITWGTGDSLLLQGVRASQVNASLFDFGAAAAAVFATDSLSDHGLAQFHSAHDLGIFA